MANRRARADLRPGGRAVPIPLCGIELRLSFIGSRNPPMDLCARHWLDVPRLVLDGVRNLLPPTVLRDRPVMSVLAGRQMTFLTHPWADHLVPIVRSLLGRVLGDIET